MAQDVLVSRVMIDAIQKNVVRRGSFFRDKFFGNVRYFRERIGQYDVIDNQVHEIAFDGYDAESNSGKMNSWDTAFVQFECAKPGRTLFPSDLQNRLPGTTAYDSPEKIAELQRLSWEELEADLIHTEEMQCVTGIKTGKVTVKRSTGATKDLADWSANAAIVSGSFSIDLSSEGAVVAWVMGLVHAVISGGSYQGTTLPGKGAAPTTLVVGSDIGNAIAKAFADGRRHMDDGSVNPALDYASEAIAYLGNVAGVQIFVCGDSTMVPAKGAIIGSTGENIMCYGPTFIPTEDGMQIVEGRRSMYTVVGKDPVGVKNILQSAPCPVVRRPADILYVVTTGTITA